MRNLTVRKKGQSYHIQVNVLRIGMLLFLVILQHWNMVSISEQLITSTLQNYNEFRNDSDYDTHELICSCYMSVLMNI